MNSVTLTGRLSKNPTLKYLANMGGMSVSEFDLAVENNYSKNKQTNKNSNVDFFKVQCWNGLAETASSNLNKGRRVLVIGFLKNNHWKDDNDKLHKDNIIVATRVEYLDYPKNDDQELGYIPPNMDEVEGKMPF